MELTAMQKLIQYLHENKHFDVIPVAKELLEKEKEQIKEAYEDGYESCDLDEVMEVNKKLTSGDLYYNMNYNQTYKNDVTRTNSNI